MKNMTRLDVVLNKREIGGIYSVYRTCFASCLVVPVTNCLVVPVTNPPCNQSRVDVLQYLVFAPVPLWDTHAQP